MKFRALTFRVKAWKTLWDKPLFFEVRSNSDSCNNKVRLLTGLLILDSRNPSAKIIKRYLYKWMVFVWCEWLHRITGLQRIDGWLVVQVTMIYDLGNLGDKMHITSAKNYQPLAGKLVTIKVNYYKHCHKHLSIQQLID